jgi:hypothetical protein
LEEQGEGGGNGEEEEGEGEEGRGCRERAWKRVSGRMGFTCNIYLKKRNANFWLILLSHG